MTEVWVGLNSPPWDIFGDFVGVRPCGLTLWMREKEKDLSPVHIIFKYFLWFVGESFVFRDLFTFVLGLL